MQYSESQLLVILEHENGDAHNHNKSPFDHFDRYQIENNELEPILGRLFRAAIHCHGKFE